MALPYCNSTDFPNGKIFISASMPFHHGSLSHCLNTPEIAIKKKSGLKED
ncbi:MAG: hypothetical protein KAQ79_06350 [Cyclobacteriaceae bacterium]|nr:hypothetical protein [Cyclobacteriaceae bacterium]